MTAGQTVLDVLVASGLAVSRGAGAQDDRATRRAPGWRNPWRIRLRLSPTRRAPGWQEKIRPDLILIWRTGLKFLTISQFI